MRLTRFNQFGDTIVEVLIAMTVVSSVLAGAYASSNKSLNANRQSQERVAAAKIVEAQLEQLKSRAGQPAPNVFTVGSPFCMVAAVEAAGPCVLKSSFDSIDYRVQIDRGAGSTFTVTANWERAGGGTTEQTVMKYRIYP